MKKFTKIIVTLILIAVSGLAFYTWISDVKFWSEVISEKQTWGYKFIDAPLSNFKSKTLSKIDWQKAQNEEEINITEKNEKGIVLLKSTFELEDINSINSILVAYNYKYSTKIYINNTLCISKGRNLITPISFSKKNLPKATIKVEEYWRATKAFLPKESFAKLIKSGQNSIVILVYNLEEIKAIKTSKIKVSILSNKIKPNKSIFIKATKPSSSFSESKLPIFSINTNQKEILDDPKISSLLHIYNNKNINQLSDTPNTFNIKIERRGFTSQSFAKKSYGFNIYNDQHKKTETPLCGLVKAKKWVLYGPYADKSLIRNALSYSLYRKMGHYAPHTQFITLIINNNYQGIYVLTEKINADKSHLNIPELTTNVNSKPQGGYLLEIDRNPWLSIYPPLNDTTSVPASYAIYYPKKKNLTAAIEQKIQQQYNTFEKHLYENSADKYDYFDINSFVDHFIISEFTKNVDAYRLSTFLYNKDISAKTPKFYIDPIWDFNFSFGLTNYNEGYKPEGFVYTSTKFIPFWWKKLMNDDTFKNTLKIRYAALRKSVLSNKNINQQIDSLYQITSPAAAINFKKWPVLGSTDFWPNYYNGKTYEDEINYIKKWSEKRLRFLDEALLAKDGKGIIFYETSIRNNEEWMGKIKTKANKKNISIDKMIQIDAKHMAKQ